MLPTPQFLPSRHPIETWQEWYKANEGEINRQLASQDDQTPGHSIRVASPYEYTDALNQRQTWQPYLTGTERQQLDTQLQIFMRQNRGNNLRLRPGPM
uniref:ARAD1B05137p n=1 Tax=Blastobotrys adeninivorans TaxID=409370 RepID=A0A060T567_BLAAD